MPRDLAGNYTLPAGNPVINGTVIEAPWANNTLSDIAVQLNNVLTRDGTLGPTLPFLLPDGTAAAPSIGFQAQANTGIYRIGGNILGFSTGGVERARVTATGFSVTGTLSASGVLFAGTGSAAAPGLAFTGDADTGLYQPSANVFAIATAGAERLQVGATGLVGIGRAAAEVLDIQGAGNALVRARGNTGFGAGFFGTQPNTDTSMFALADRGTTLGGPVGTITSLYTAPATPLYFDVAGSPAAIISAAGLVGIGELTPTASLHISRAGDNAVNLIAGRLDSDPSFKLVARNGSGSGTGAIAARFGLEYGLAGLQAGLQFHRGSGAVDGSVSFLASSAEIVRIAAAGLGIGTNAPSALLDMYGAFGRFRNASYSGTIGAGDSLVSGAAANTFALRSDTDLLLASGGATARMTLLAGGAVKVGDTPAVGQTLNVLTNISIAKGAGVTNPYLTFTAAGADTETYLQYDIANNDFIYSVNGGISHTFKVGGVSKVIIDSAGYTRFIDGSSLGYFGSGTSLASGVAANIFTIRSDPGLSIATGAGDERLHITSGGRVGIGTNVPSKMLHVRLDSGVAGTRPGVMIENRNAAGGTEVGELSFAAYRDVANPSIIGAITSTLLDGLPGNRGRMDFRVARNGTDNAFNVATGLALVAENSSLVTPYVLPEGTEYEIGFRDVPFISVASPTALVRSHRGKCVSSNGSTVTVNVEATSGLGLGSIVSVHNNSAGTMTIARGAGMSLYLAGAGSGSSADRTLASHALATVYYISSAIAIVSGGGVS